MSNIDLTAVYAHLTRAEESVELAARKPNITEATLYVAIAAEHVRAAVALVKQGTAQSVVDAQEKLNQQQ